MALKIWCSFLSLASKADAQANHIYKKGCGIIMGKKTALQNVACHSLWSNAEL